VSQGQLHHPSRSALRRPPLQQGTLAQVSGRHAHPSQDENPARTRSAVASLVHCAAGGDHKAWDALVHRFAPMVGVIVGGHRLNPATAEGVFEITWLRLLQHLDDIDEPGRVGVWLAVTARRESLRARRLVLAQTVERSVDQQSALPAPHDQHAAPGAVPGLRVSAAACHPPDQHAAGLEAVAGRVVGGSRLDPDGRAIPVDGHRPHQARPWLPPRWPCVTLSDGRRVSGYYHPR
jgi:hypothetical protein